MYPSGGVQWPGAVVIPLDSAEPDVRLKHADLSSAHATFATFVDLCQRSTRQVHADQIRRAFKQSSYTRAISLVGGDGFQRRARAEHVWCGDRGRLRSCIQSLARSKAIQSFLLFRPEKRATGMEHSSGTTLN